MKTREIPDKVRNEMEEEHNKIQKDLKIWQEISMKKLANHLEVFNDAIIAIISTIMVLEIPIPSKETSYLEFLYTIIIFFVSFIIVINFWYKNHQISSILKKVDKAYLILNFVFIIALSLIPILTKWLMLEHNSLAVAHLGIVYLIVSVVNLIMASYAYRQFTKETKWTMMFYNHIQKVRIIILFILNIVLIILAFIFPTCAMLIYLGIPILTFLSPNR